MQPYPTGTQVPERDRPPIPPQVRSAIKAMYVGAAATVVGVVIEILTIGATKTEIEKRSSHLTASQVTATEHTLVIGIVISGLIAVAAWIFLWQRASTQFFRGTA